MSILSQAAHNPLLAVVLILTMGVAAVSGATDAPNAIAAAVSTRSIKLPVSLVLAAIFDCAGLIGMTFISTAVAHTMFAMVDFSGNTDMALIALVAAMVGAVGWGVVCWFASIPISKSHALIAGITGAAIALNGLSGVVPGEWVKVLYGMAFSLIAGFGFGWLFIRLVEKAFQGIHRKITNTLFQGLQDILSLLTACLHGAQDGQKFMTIAVMGIMLSFGLDPEVTGNFPAWLMVACSISIAIGLFVGGKRIIRSVGMGVVKMERAQGMAASASTIVTLLVSSLTGMPVSTSHCATSAIMGVGASRSLRRVNWSSAKNMVMAWVLTFPCCGVIGFVLAKLFMLL